MLQSKKLSWDSDFFRINIAKIETENASVDELNQAIAQLKNEGIKLIYIFSSKAIDISEYTSDSQKFIDVGPKVLYHKELTKAPDYHPQIESFKAVEVSDKLYDLALQSGVYSRFKLDPKLPRDAYEKLYRIWIKNSVNRSIADEVVVFMESGEIAGMVTLSKKGDWGDIGLIAVDETFRGKKIGHHLLNAAYKYFYDLGITEIGVETQLNNLGACRFYEANEFLVHKVEYLYHCWLK
jgi:dTDP-4-amino-4,6-dideoxy-D-galactose acyltransferase